MNKIIMLMLVFAIQSIAVGENAQSKVAQTQKSESADKKQVNEEPKRDTIHIGIKVKDLPPAVLKAINQVVLGKDKTYCKVLFERADHDDLINIQKKDEEPLNEEDVSYMVETEENGNMVFYFFNQKGELINSEVQEVIGGGLKEQDKPLGDEPVKSKK